jgi:hypothetical protein
MGQSSSSHFVHTIFHASLAPTARAKCRKCGRAIKQGSLRVSRKIPTKTIGNNDDGTVVQHYHAACASSVAASMRCASKATAWDVDEAKKTPPPELRVAPGVDASRKDVRALASGFERARLAHQRRCQ